MCTAGARFECVKGPLDRDNPSNRKRKRRTSHRNGSKPETVSTPSGVLQGHENSCNCDGGPMILVNGGQSVRQGPTRRTRKGAQRAKIQMRSIVA